MEEAGWSLGSGAYWSACVCAAVFFSAFSGLICLGFTFDPSASVLVLAFVFFLLLAVAFFLPGYWSRRRAEALERDLPACLSSLAVQLELGLPFEECLANAAGGGFGLLSGEFGRVADAVSFRGASVPGALEVFAGGTGSLAVKRACAQLAWVYANGVGASDLRLHAEGLLAEQEQRLREFNARLALLGILFIVVSSLGPAFFSVAVALGEFLGWRFSQTEVFLAYGVVFPVLDAALLFYAYLKTPKLLSM